MLTCRLSDVARSAKLAELMVKLSGLSHSLVHHSTLYSYSNDHQQQLLRSDFRHSPAEDQEGSGSSAALQLEAVAADLEICSTDDPEAAAAAVEAPDQGRVTLWFPQVRVCMTTCVCVCA
jgi:hypothetical protein